MSKIKKHFKENGKVYTAILVTAAISTVVTVGAMVKLTHGDILLTIGIKKSRIFWDLNMRVFDLSK